MALTAHKCISCKPKGLPYKFNIVYICRARLQPCLFTLCYVISHCHPVKITKAKTSFEIDNDKIKVICEVEGFDRTGFEMEALYGICVALLTIYDMCKVYKKEIKITEIYLKKKTKQ